jgi:hypothetical protein
MSGAAFLLWAARLVSLRELGYGVAEGLAVLLGLLAVVAEADALLAFVLRHVSFPDEPPVPWYEEPDGRPAPDSEGPSAAGLGLG